MKTILITVVAILSYSFTGTGIEGIWKYEAPNAPPGYEKGDLKISKAGIIFKNNINRVIIWQKLMLFLS